MYNGNGTIYILMTQQFFSRLWNYQLYDRKKKRPLI